MLAASDVTGKAVLLHTGGDRHWGTPAYADDAPYLTEAGARRLVEQRAALVGIDAINIDDTTGGGHRPAHSVLLEAGIPIVEHLTGLDQVPRHRRAVHRCAAACHRVRDVPGPGVRRGAGHRGLIVDLPSTKALGKRSSTNGDGQGLGSTAWQSPERGVVTLDCADAWPLAEFWAAMLGGEIVYSSAAAVVVRTDWVALSAMTIPDYAPPTWPDAAVPKQIHLDLAVTDLETAVAEAERLGAEPAPDQPAPDQRRVLFDPAGHPFCLTTRYHSRSGNTARSPHRLVRGPS